MGTGRAVDPEHWIEAQVRRTRLEDDTQRIADVLSTAGYQSRRAGPGLTLVGRVTGAVAQSELYANWNLLPSVAQRNRRPLLRELTWFLAQHGQARRYTRYAVWTAGRRLPLYSAELRPVLRRLSDAVSRWAEYARRRGVEVYFRGAELTVDEHLTVHPHINVLYHPTRKLSKKEFAELSMKARQLAGGWVRDTGRVEDLAEVVKYVFKGDDLALLMDAAEVVPAWGGSGFVSQDFVASLSRRLRDRSKRDGVCLDDHQAWAAAYAQSREVSVQLGRAAASGAAHPLVWLHEALSGLHLVQPLGAFRRWRGDLARSGQRVVVVHSSRGPRLALEQKPRRNVDRLDDRRPGRDCALELAVHDMSSERGPDGYKLYPERAIALRFGLDVMDVARILRVPRELWAARSERLPGPPPENQVVGETAPTARFSPWAEPCYVVLNYQKHPKTKAGLRGLAHMQAGQAFATRQWLAAGAPAPSAALRQAGALKARHGLLDDGGPGVAGSVVRQATMSFIVHNCTITPHEGQDADASSDGGSWWDWCDGPDGSRWHRETGEIIDGPSRDELWSEIESGLDSPAECGGLEWWEDDALGWPELLREVEEFSDIPF